MYGRQYGRGGDMGRFFRRDGAPLTMGIIVANMVTFLIGFALIGNPELRGVLYEVLAFTSRTFPMFFWTLVTWPIAATSETDRPDSVELPATALPLPRLRVISV